MEVLGARQTKGNLANPAQIAKELKRNGFIECWVGQVMVTVDEISIGPPDYLLL